MSTIFQSWHDLFAILETKAYQLSQGLKNYFIEQINDDLLPIVLQHISANSISLAYFGSRNPNNLWHLLEIASFPQALNISNYLPIVNNPIITIEDFQTNNYSLYINIPQLSKAEATILLNSFPGLPNFTKDCFSNVDSNVCLFLSNSEIYLNFANDLQLNLDEIFNIHSAVPYMDIALDRIITEIFSKPELRISAPKFGFFKGIQGFELCLKGLLNYQ